MTGRADYLVLGDWNSACFECGRKRKASTMERHWKGYYVCPEHWEPRQAQDFVRAITEKPAPPWVQPQTDTFLGVGYAGAIAGLAVAGTAIAGFTFPS